MPEQHLYNVEAEESVLGSMLIDPEALFRVAPFLVANDFFIHRNRFVYEAIVRAAKDGGVDFVSVSDYLERAGHLLTIGGAVYLSRLINCVPSAFRAEQYAKIVCDYSTRRGLIAAASTTAQAAYDLDVNIDEAQARAESAVMGARRESGERRTDAGDLAGQLYERFDDWISDAPDDWR